MHSLNGSPVESGEDGCNIINWVGVILSTRDCYIELSRHPVAIIVSQIIHLAYTFIQSDLFRLYIFLISMCVHWELNPQPFALLTQCSTTEP